MLEIRESLSKVGKQVQELDYSTQEEIRGKDYMGHNNIFGNVHHYGLRALAHIDLMGRANDVLNDRMTFKDFKTLYDPVKDRYEGKPGILLRSLADAGVFITEIHYNKHIAGRFTTFEGDLNTGMEYRSIVLEELGKKDKRAAYEEIKKYYRENLQKRGWKMEEFIDPGVIRKGADFGNLLLNGVISHYRHRLDNPNPNELFRNGDFDDLTDREIELGTKLANHYEAAGKILMSNITDK